MSAQGTPRALAAPELGRAGGTLLEPAEEPPCTHNDFGRLASRLGEDKLPLFLVAQFVVTSQQPGQSRLERGQETIRCHSTCTQICCQLPAGVKMLSLK